MIQMNQNQQLHVAIVFTDENISWFEDANKIQTCLQ